MTVTARPASAGWCRLRRGVALVGVGLLGGAVGMARADVWGFVDDKGMPHFAAEPLDARYELFLRGSASLDDRADPPAAMAVPRPVRVPTSPAKLWAYFEVAPGYKAVQHHLREASQANGIDYELLMAVIATESGFDRSAISPKGAVGLMQLMPATAQRFGVTADGQGSVAQKLADPGTNIRAGSRYLGALLKRFPDRPELALAAYNAGEGAVLRAGNRVPDLRETQDYVATVLQLYTLLKPPAAVTAQRAMRLRRDQDVEATARAPLISPTVAPAASAVALTESD